jgi:hypothetical protein
VKEIIWENVIWPVPMSTMDKGMFRIREYKTVTEWTFTPQWRNAMAGSDWQDFKYRNPGRCSGVNVIRFTNKENAEAFIEQSLKKQPILEIHEYRPEQGSSSDWGFPK